MSWWSEETAYLSVFGVSHVIYVIILVASLELTIGFRKVFAGYNIIALIIRVIDPVISSRNKPLPSERKHFEA